MEAGLMTTIYVLDTETTTTTFRPVPNGHVVEIGIAEVNLEEHTVQPYYSDILTVKKMVKGKKKIDPEAWVFKNTTLTVEEVENGKDPEEIAIKLADMLKGCELTAFNQSFDQLMLKRDLPQLHDAVVWGQDLMLQADNLSSIPRTKAPPCYPNAENTYNHLCKDDPAHINGKEEHRALSDAIMEGYILLALYDRGLYTPKQGATPVMKRKDDTYLNFIHRNMEWSTEQVRKANEHLKNFLATRDVSELEKANEHLEDANDEFRHLNYSIDKRTGGFM